MPSTHHRSYRRLALSGVARPAVAREQPRHGDEIFAEVVLPKGFHGGAG